MRKIDLEQSETELFTDAPGLALVGLCIRHSGLSRRLARVERGGRSFISTLDIFTAFIGLLCCGKSDYAALEAERKNPWFKEALGLDHVPSSASLRQRLDKAGRAGTGLAAVVGESAIELLCRLQVAVTGCAGSARRLIPLDIDVFPQDNSDTKKEGVSWTYKGFSGYAPIGAYLGAEGWCLGVELRPGSQHGQNGFVDFLNLALRRARRLTQSALLVRLDGAHDAGETFVALRRCPGVRFVVRWNTRNEERQGWLARARRIGVEEVGCREGVRSWLLESTVERRFGEERVKCRRIVRVREERIDERGQVLAFPEIHLEGWLTDLRLPARKVMSLYRDHGTSEQFHSEFKTDLDLERLPSKRFGTNALVMSLGQLSYNLLRALGQRGLLGGSVALRHPVKRRRVRTVMRELILGAARVIRRGHRLVLRFGRHCPVFDAFCGVYEWLRAACVSSRLRS